MIAEVADQAFEPFFTTKARGKGTGLGLATVYGIAQAADGCVWIDSKPGRGTTVEVYLPAGTDAVVAEIAAAPSQLQGFGETILLVEDDESGRRATERILKENGYAVLAVSNPEDALRACEDGARIDAMLTDVIMPRISGVELAKRVRDQRPSIAIAYISGYAEGAMPDGVSPSSGDPLIEKPFSASTLLAGMRTAIESPSSGGDDQRRLGERVRPGPPGADRRPRGR